MQVHPIYTEDNNCQDCYKCVRECPVKAIKIENHSASIISERCIYCGHCTTICPSNAKKVREDIKTVSYFIEQGLTVAASLAPSFISEFSEWTKEQLISALHKLGFQYVSETALGAEMVSDAVEKYIDNKPKGVHISSCCPTIVDLVHRFYPELKNKVTPITTPMLAHGALLKEKLGDATKVVFIGPCIAKKKEAEKNSGAIDAVITFKKLKEWFQQLNITPETIDTTENAFFPQSSYTGSMYPIDGGMLTSLNTKIGVTAANYMCFSGLNTVIDLLQNIDRLDTNNSVFLELMACSGGCVNGPATTCSNNIASKRIDIINHFNQLNYSDYKTPEFQHKTITNEFTYLAPAEKVKYSNPEITKALQSFGKYSEKDELNCSGCGYESCRDFARALLDNIAEPTMCVSHMRSTAQRQASLLMQKMPYAVVLVNDKLKIQESNKHFASLLGDDTEMAFEHTPGLTGYDLTKLLPPHKYFSNLLESGSEIIEKDIKINNSNVHLSIFTIQKHKLVCGIIHAFNSPEILKTEIQRRSKQVIKQNLKTVQKIALLLGENASQTEAMLNSLVNIEE